MRSKILGLFFLTLILTNACQQHHIDWPAYVQVSDRAPFDRLTYSRVTLGKLLFADPRLSINDSVSCMSCHNPNIAFTDSQVRSIGIYGRLSMHNSSTLINVALNPDFMYVRRAHILENQSLIPLNDTNEMGMPIIKIPSKLRSDIILQLYSLMAYGKWIDIDVITRALADYIRSLIRFDRPIDRYLATGNRAVFDSLSWRGYQIFSTKADCARCHPAPLFTDHRYYDLGLESDSTVLGLMGATHDPNDRHRYKTPTLRYISLTAPYFHNGSVPNIDSLLEFKSRHLSRDYSPPKLSDSDLIALKHFLTTML